MSRKISKSFKGKSCRLTFSSNSVGSSEGVMLRIPCKLYKGDLKSSSMSVFKNPPEAEKFSCMLIYAVICFDPRESCFMVWTSMPTYLPNYLWESPNKRAKGKMNEEKNGSNHKKNNYLIQKVKYIFFFCL